MTDAPNTGDATRSAYVEKALTFGPDKSLVGVATLPSSPRDGAPFVVLLNAGLMHRVGPFRMSVELARHLAAHGVGTLRFDLSSIGDSPARPGLSPEQAAVADCRDAFDLAAERFGATRFVVAGLCTGAMNAHRAALADERVVGMCLLDGYAYKTLSYDLQRVARHLESPEAVLSGVKSLFRKAKQAIGHEAPAPASEPSPPSDERIGIFYQEWPPAEAVQGELERILGRGVKALFVYTGGWDGFVHPRQFEEMFPALRHRERAKVRYFSEADHTYYLRSQREEMQREVLGFVEGLA